MLLIMAFMAPEKMIRRYVSVFENLTTLTLFVGLPSRWDFRWDEHTQVHAYTCLAWTLCNMRNLRYLVYKIPDTPRHIGEGLFRIMATKARIPALEILCLDVRFEDEDIPQEQLVQFVCNHTTTLKAFHLSGKAICLTESTGGLECGPQLCVAIQAVRRLFGHRWDRLKFRMWET